MSLRDLKHSLDYLHSEINCIETMAGTLSTTEREHFNRLSKVDNREIMDIATEEQSSSRQLGAMQQMCLAMAQKIDGIKNAIDQVEPSGSIEHD